MNTNDSSTDFMTAKQAAEYLNVPLSRIRYEVFNNTIPFIKINKSVRFSKTDLKLWIESKKNEVKNGG